MLDREEFVMRVQNRWGVLLFLLFGGCWLPSLASCGGSFCQRSKDAVISLREKAAPCRSTSISLNLNAEKCEKYQGECSPNDLEKIEAGVACYNAMGTCSEESRNAWNGQYIDCLKKFEGLSLRCASIFN